MDSVVLVVSSVADAESVEIPSTGTVIGRDAGEPAIYIWGHGCVGCIHSNPAEGNSTRLEAGKPRSVTSNCCTALMCNNLAIFLMLLANQIFCSAWKRSRGKKQNRN